MKANTMLKKILFITVLCFMFNACNDYLFKDRQELIVVSKTPMGAFAGGNDWADKVLPKYRHIGWYEIGLSRNGEEPVEYIWRAENDEFGHYIINAIIGERGTIYLCDWAKQRKIKLPRPNAENPPTIGAIGEVYWKKQKSRKTEETSHYADIQELRHETLRLYREYLRFPDAVTVTESAGQRGNLDGFLDFNWGDTIAVAIKKLEDNNFPFVQFTDYGQTIIAKGVFEEHEGTIYLYFHEGIFYQGSIQIFPITKKVPLYEDPWAEYPLMLETYFNNNSNYEKLVNTLNEKYGEQNTIIDEWEEATIWGFDNNCTVIAEWAYSKGIHVRITYTNNTIANKVLMKYIEKYLE